MSTEKLNFIVDMNKGDSVKLFKSEAMQVPLFCDIIQFAQNSSDSINIKIPFSDKSIKHYFQWIETVTDTVLQMEWMDIIDLFFFADFTGCENFKTYFVLNIVEHALTADILTIQILLSLTKDHAYLEAKYNDEDFLYDPLESFDNADYLLSYTKLNDLTH